MANVIRIRPDNFRPASKPSGLVKAIAEDAIALAEREKDYELATRLRMILEGIKRDQWPF